MFFGLIYKGNGFCPTDWLLISKSYARTRQEQWEKEKVASLFRSQEKLSVRCMLKLLINWSQEQTSKKETVQNKRFKAPWLYLSSNLHPPRGTAFVTDQPPVFASPAFCIMHRGVSDAGLCSFEIDRSCILFPF